MYPRRLLMVIVVIATSASFARGGDVQPNVDLNQNAALRYYRALALIAEEGGIRSKDGWELVGKWGTPEADEQASKIIRSNRHLLDLLHDGARIQGCQWGMDDLTIETLLPQLQLMRHLARTGCFRAHYRFRDGDVDGAVADTCAVIALGRHVGQDPTLIGRLVSVAVQSVGIELLATNLDKLSEDQLTALDAELQRLQRITDLPYAHYIDIDRHAVIDDLIQKIENGEADRVRRLISGEGDSLIAQVVDGMDDAQLIKTIRGTESFYDDAKQACELPLEPMVRQLEVLVDDASTSNNVALRVMFSNFGSAFRAFATGQARFVMLRAGVAYRLAGADALARFEDPYGGGKFEIRQVEGGFELVSKAKRSDGKPVTLRIGLPPAE